MPRNEKVASARKPKRKSTPFAAAVRSTLPKRAKLKSSARNRGKVTGAGKRVITRERIAAVKPAPMRSQTQAKMPRRNSTAHH